MALTNCKECNKEVSTKAETCPHCGAKQKTSSSFGGCLIVVALLVLLVVIISMMDYLKNNPANNAAALNTNTPTAPKIETKQRWDYYQTNDEMSSKPIYTTAIKSDNQVNFDFPYKGPQRATLRARTHPRWGKDLMFEIEKGQILCSSYKGCVIGVKFDDGKIESYSANEPSDHSSTTIFIKNYSRFMGKLLKAKTLKISIEIYQQGTRTFTFNIADFSVDKYLPQ